MRAYGRDEYDWVLGVLDFCQKGGQQMTQRSFTHRDPPAARLYAVDPVGVATQTPSACTVVM